jgi:hypothetical protein
MLRNHPNDEKTIATVDRIIDGMSQNLSNRGIVQTLEYFIKKQRDDSIYYSKEEFILNETPLANYVNPGNMPEGATCLSTVIEYKIAELKNTASYKVLIDNSFYTNKFNVLRASYQTACDTENHGLKIESLEKLRALAAGRNPEAEKFIQAYDDLLAQQAKSNSKFSLRRIFRK